LIRADQLQNPALIKKKGIVGQALINGQSIANWSQRPFLTGELLDVIFAVNSTSAEWQPSTGTGPTTPLTWFRTTFSTPPTNQPVVINMLGATRGHFYINGIDMGRFGCHFVYFVRTVCILDD
jgi:hypothetical protein